MRIIAIDPGGTTGWVLWEGGTFDSDGYNLGAFGSLGPDEHHYKLRSLLTQAAQELRSHQRPATDMIVVCERFEHRNAEFAKLISCEYIGVVKSWCQEFEVRLVMQGSNQAKNWATDDKLERLGLPLQKPKSKKPQKDINDAMRHLVYFLCNNKTTPTLAQSQMLRMLK